MYYSTELHDLKSVNIHIAGVDCHRFSGAYVTVCSTI